MGNLEEVPIPSGDQGDLAEVIQLNFGGKSLTELEVEDLLLKGFLSDENSEFILDKVNSYQVTIYEVLNSAIESYRTMCELTEGGGTLFVRGRDGRLHKLSDEPDPSDPNFTGIGKNEFVD